MCALTLPVSAAFARETLHASVVHAGYTVDVNATRLPVGDQTGPVAPPLRVVSCLWLLPSASETHSCPPAMNATRRPSGDHRPSVALTSLAGNCRAAPPEAGT